MKVVIYNLKFKIPHKGLQFYNNMKEMKQFICLSQPLKKSFNEH